MNLQTKTPHGILPNEEDATTAIAEITMDERGETLQLIQKLEPIIPNLMSVDDYLGMEDSLEIEKEMTDAEIIKMVLGDDAKDSDDDQEPEPEEPLWSSARVLDALKTLETNSFETGTLQ